MAIQNDTLNVKTPLYVIGNEKPLTKPRTNLGPDVEEIDRALIEQRKLREALEGARKKHLPNNGKKDKLK